MTTRKKCIAANWKLNKTRQETKAFIETLLHSFSKMPEADVLIAPPFTSIEQALRSTEGAQLLIGAQNLSFAESGAYTGEVSAAMLKELGVHFVLIGHSERRVIFQESDEEIHKKIGLCRLRGISPLLCVGETAAEKERGESEAVIKRQLESALKGGVLPEGLRIAYEPVWAIGSGSAATPEYAQKMHSSIRRVLATFSQQNEEKKVQILYGGSVRSETVREMLAEPDIDGCLVGGSSLDPHEFYTLILEAEKYAQ